MENKIVKVENGQIEMVTNAQLLMKELDRQIAELTAERDTYKDMLLNAMIENGIYKFDTEVMSVTATQPIRKKLNVVAFKNDHPDLYEEYKMETVNETRLKDEMGKVFNEYCEETPVKPSLRIKYKG